LVKLEAPVEEEDIKKRAEEKEKLFLNKE